MNRVVVTGMGAVTACGIGIDPLWSAARDGKSAVGPVSFPDLPMQQVKAAARIPAELDDAIWTGGNRRLMDRFTALALNATRQAVAAAGLSSQDFGSSAGAIVGSGGGGVWTIEKNLKELYVHPSQRPDPMSIPKAMTNAAASWIGMEFGITGPTICISTACSSATQSIGLAAQMIRAGMIQRCVAGGSEAMLVANTFRAWELLRVMTPGLCRPFSDGRDGMVLGEGAGIVVLESLEAARGRGAPILAEIVGYGTTGDSGSDLLRSDPDKAAACIKAAMSEAGVGATDIAYVNAHGTGTVANEQAETAALRSVFGERLRDVLVSSTKPVHGHALGAAGGIELIVTLKALAERVAPPTINFKGIDPKLGIDPVANTARPFTGDVCLTNSFAFGGINATLAVARYQAA